MGPCWQRIRFLRPLVIHCQPLQRLRKDYLASAVGDGFVSRSAVVGNHPGLCRCRRSAAPFGHRGLIADAEQHRWAHRFLGLLHLTQWLRNQGEVSASRSAAITAIEVSEDLGVRPRLSGNHLGWRRPRWRRRANSRCVGRRNAAAFGAVRCGIPRRPRSNCGGGPRFLTGTTRYRRGATL